MDTSDSGNYTILFNTNFDRVDEIRRFLCTETIPFWYALASSNYRKDFDIETFEAHQRISQFSKFLPSYFLLP